MSEVNKDITQEEKAEYFACPICRFVFKVRSSSGNAVQCPGCHFLVSFNDMYYGARSVREEIIAHDMLRGAEKKWEVSHSAQSKKKNGSFSDKGLLIILASCLLLSILFIGTLIFSQNEKADGNQTDEKHVIESFIDHTSVHTSPNQESEEIAEGDFEAQITELVIDYANSVIVSEIWGFIDQRSVTIAKVQRQYQKFPKNKLNIDRVSKITQLSDSVYRVTCAVENSEVEIVVIKDEGDFKVDWLATEGISMDHPDDLQNKYTDSIEMRVTISQGDLYNDLYDANELKCYELNFTNAFISSNGYVEIEQQELIKQLDQAIFRNENSLILKLENFPDKQGNYQFKITSIISKNWKK